MRVGEVLRHALAEIFVRNETQAAEIDRAGLTVLEVTMSPDLRMAIAYVTPLGGKNGPQVLDALNRSRKRIKGLMSGKMNLKYMPDIQFRLDVSLDNAGHITRLLNKPEVSRDLASSGSAPVK